MSLFRIAVDGPSGSGKSTIAKILAKEYHLEYVDTGAMYRAMGLKILREGIACEEGPELEKLLSETEIDFSDGKITLDGEDVSGLIRTQEISKMASDCSAFATVRTKLDTIQKAIGRTKNVVMDGRDIGTVVMPDAEYKFYITATPEERASRRYKELLEKGEDVDYETILREVNERDYNDINRKVNPLRKADDAIEIDTTNLTIDEVVNRVKMEIQFADKDAK